MTGHVDHLSQPAAPGARRATDSALELLELAQDPIIIRDADDRVTFWNAAAERAYGWTRAEAAGRVTHELLRTRFPTSRDDALAAVRRDGAWEGEITHAARDGREVVMSSRWTARRDPLGNVVEVLETNRDVTAQRAAEARLRASERLLRQAEQIAGVGSWEWDVRSDRLTWSDTMCALFGVTQREVPASFEEYLARIHPDDRFHARAVTEQAYAERAAFEFEHRLVRPDGVVRHLHGRGEVIVGADGQVARLVGSGQDVTDRLASERAIRESESRYRTIADSTPALLWQTDADGRCVFVNRAWATLTGRPAESEYGAGWLAWMHPEDRAWAEPRFAAAVRARRAFELEYRVRGADASWRWLLSVGVPRFADDGAFAGHVGSCVDLTEREEAESALRASEERFAAIVTQATTGFAEVDVAGRFVLANDRFCELVGRARDELLALHMHDVTHPDDWPRSAALLRRAIETGAPFEIEKRYVRPDGSAVWVRNSVTCIRDRQGEVRGVFSVSVDVSARRRAEQKLSVLAAAGSALTASLDLTNTLGALTELAVPALADWCTVFLCDAAGMPRLAASACARPEKAEAVARAAARAADMRGAERHPARVVVATGRALRITRDTAAALDAISDDAEYRALVATLAPVSAVAAPLVARGRVLGALMLVSDDPARAYDDDDLRLAEDLARRAGAAVDNVRLHEAEHRARAVAESSAARTERVQRVTAALSGSVTSEEVARVTLDAGVDALGADAAYMVLLDESGEAFSAIHAVGLSEASLGRWRGAPASAHNPLAEAVRTREVVSYETAAERAARYGEPPPGGFEASVVVPLAVEGRAFGAWSVAFRAPRAFTAEDRRFVAVLGQQAALALERARLYEAERLARSEAEAANRAKSEFLAVMSHELRTPLNAIAGYAELLELGVHGPLTERQRDDIGRIRRSQRHLLGLINQILTHARIETGTVRYDTRDVAVAEALSSVEALILPQARAKSLDLHMASCPPGAVALADAGRLEQVLLNLVSNAVKFTGRGGRVDVLCEVAPQHVLVHVRDTGLGIPADKLEAVFEPFVQVHGGLTRQHEGTGLGLAISRDLARGMGGELTTESTLGEGSTFTLRLPRGRSVRRARGA